MICLSYPDILTVIGLTLDAVGIVLLFWYAPEKYPDPQYGSTFALEGEDKIKRERWKADQPKRKKLANWSIGIIVAGFALQALAVIIW